MTEYYSRTERQFKGNRIFTIPFPYLDENDIVVSIEGTTTNAWEWINPTSIMLNAPVNFGELVEIRRNTPINEKVVDYKNTSMVLNEDNLNLSHNQLVYATQEIYDNVSFNVETTNKVVESMDSIVEIAAESVKKVEQHAQNASDYADLAREYAQQVEYGVRWVTFTEANWEAEDDKYMMSLDGHSLIILGVYKTGEGIKHQVANVDITVKENRVILTSPEAFAGGFLSVARVVGHYAHEQEIAADEWVIKHSLGKYPVVTIVDTNGYVQLGSIQYTSLDEVVICFENPIKGFAYLS